MRRATGISITLHGAAVAALLLAAQAAPPPRLEPPRAVALTLAPVPMRKPAPPAPAPPQPQSKPAPAEIRRPVPPPTAVRTATAAPLAIPAQSAPPQATAPAAAAVAPPASAPMAAAPAHAPTGAPDPSWLGRVRARLEAAKRYPPAAARRGEQGVVSIRLEVARDGRVLSSALIGGSGSGFLDREAMALPDRVTPLPPMPDTMAGDSVTLVVPVSFTLH